MAGVERKANLTWKGGLTEGSGSVSGASSGAFTDLDVTWASRTEQPGGKTSPEELIAAAHAACFAMGLSFGLQNNETPPAQLDVEATCTLEMQESGPKIAAMHFDVTGQVDGIDQDTFATMASGAAQDCPVSAMMKGNVDVSVSATLK